MTLIQRTCAAEFNLPLSAMTAAGRGSRMHRLVFARQLSMLLCLEMIPGMSLPMVGKRHGKRDHTTVLYGRNRLRRRRENDPEFAAFVASVKTKIVEAANEIA